MKIKKLVIVAGGDLSTRFLPHIRKADLVIAADYGAWWLLNQGITPDYAIGDFDSVNKHQFTKIKQKITQTIVHPAEKDDTDISLALDLALQQNPDSVTIFGATGDRLDHFWAVCQKLSQEKFNQGEWKILTDNQEIFFLVKGKKKVIPNSYQYISLFSFSPQSKINLVGFKYGGDELKLINNYPLGISNCLTAIQGKIKVVSGLVLVILSTKDKK